jgi:hypothetical protein
MYPGKNASLSLIVGAACLGLTATTSPTPAQGQGAAALNYDFFKNKVQAVFLEKRPGHTRCVVCHTTNNAPFHLVPMSPGATTWNEEQSKMNFELIHRVAAAGVMDSPLIHHPLALEAGGDAHHGGGQQFTSQDDPDWQILKAFVSGAK